MCEDEKQKGTDEAGPPRTSFVGKSTGCETYEKNVERKNFVQKKKKNVVFFPPRTGVLRTSTASFFFVNANKHLLYKKMCIQIQKNLLAASQLANSAAFDFKIIYYGYTTTN